MKETLKALAVSLPAEYEAEFVENDLKLACDHGYCKTYVFVSDTRTPIENSKGTTVLLQYIESKGYNYQLSSFVNETPKVYRVTWCKTLKEARDGEQVAFGATIAEAVSKAALEVAGRMK